MAMLRIINLGIRFLLELGALGSLVYCGTTLSATTAVRATAAVALPLLIALFWGIFISPKARIPTGPLGQAGLGLVVFLAAAAALASRGHATLAGAFSALAVVSSLLLYVWPQ